MVLLKYISIRLRIPSLRKVYKVRKVYNRPYRSYRARRAYYITLVTIPYYIVPPALLWTVP